MTSDFSWDRLSEAFFRERLAQARRLPPDDPYPPALLQGPPRPAAVLVPLLRREGAWHLLFIRRAAHPHDPHSGQVAFPGGGCEGQDADPRHTALREAQEEIGLAPQAVRLLGELPPQRTISNYWVTPVVGVVPWPYPYRTAPEEVARLFTVPLTWLANPAHHEIRYRTLPPPHPPIPVVYFQPYEGEVIWGATARMVLRFLRVLRGDQTGPIFPPFPR